MHVAACGALRPIITRHLTNHHRARMQGAAGLQYSSKLDDFDTFVAHSKLAVLPLAHVAHNAAGSAAAGAGAAGPSSSQQPTQASQAQHTQQQQQQQAAMRGSGGAASTSGGGGSGSGKLLLLDDLPFVGDAERRQRLMGSLKTLCLTSRCPVVLVTTEASGGGVRGGAGGGAEGGGGLGAMGGFSKGLHKVRSCLGGCACDWGLGGLSALSAAAVSWRAQPLGGPQTAPLNVLPRQPHHPQHARAHQPQQEVVALLDSLGATTITFNPVTTNALTKTLLALAVAEGVDLQPLAAAAIAHAADGDLRNAMQNLQVYSGGAPRALVKPGKGAGAAVKGRKRAAAKGSKGAGGSADEAQQRRLVAQVGRDQRLSLYHALGKLLHNKRDPIGGAAAEEEAAAGGSKRAKRQRVEQGGQLSGALGADVFKMPLGAALIELREE